MKPIKKFPKIFYFAAGILITLGAIFIFTSFYFVDKVDDDDKEKFPQQYKVVTPPIPEDPTFAGEDVPVYNFEVKERLERELIVNTYFHSYTILSIKRANRWFPVIEPILAKNNVPDDFKYLCAAESNFENVVSPAGARGFWQFMESSGEEYGLEINGLIDERYHVEKATQAACEYLKNAYELFGNWTMAAASYNMGVSGTTKQMKRQKANNYYNLVLNPETSRYVARIIALKYIIQDPDIYCFDIKEEELYQPLQYKEVVLDTSVVDFADYADSFGINYKILKLYNPWIRDNYLNIIGNKSYKVKIPEAGSIEVID